MKISATILTLASLAQAHYNFQALVYGGTTYPKWEHVRKRVNTDSHGPVENVASQDLRCGQGAAFAPSILSVSAGSTLGWQVDPSIQHYGPTIGYLAKVPSGKTAANWDGSGAVWFKVYEKGPTITSSSIDFPFFGATTLSFKIPQATPSGDYLARIEHIALHGAGSTNGAQFYLSCGQITVTNGGNGNPGPKVAFPGAYSPTDPGILINVYWPVPTSYTIPGPPVWS